jgi:tetratricopeptide (TPR) repeat protein
MFIKKIKNILGFRSNNQKTVNQSVGNILKFFSKSINKFIIDLKLMSRRSKNLADSNFKLGNKYYRKGNYSEASFRFWILIKFFPEHTEGHFMLAQSLLAQNKFQRAEKVLETLVRKKPAFKDRAIELLHQFQETNLK